MDEEAAKSRQLASSRENTGNFNMKPFVSSILLILCYAFAAFAFPAESMDSLSGLPVLPNSIKTTDPVQSYNYCGKNAITNAYIFSGLTDDDSENRLVSAKAWYLKALPQARVYTGPAGHVVFVTPDGTAAVILSGMIVSFIRFSPGLSPAEMNGLGAAPPSRECHSS